MTLRFPTILADQGVPKMRIKFVSILVLFTKVGKLKGNDIETGRSRVEESPHFYPFRLYTELPRLVERKSKQTLFILELNGSICMFLYIKKNLKKKFYILTYIWPTLFSFIAF